MEQFAVRPTSLNGYAEQIRRNAGFIGQTRNYLADAGDRTDKMDGILSGIVDGYHRVLAWQLGVLDDMNRKLTDTGTALDQTSDSYRHTDLKHARELDETYPAPPENPPPGADDPKHEKPR
jgi:hypothetical protein